MNVLPRRNVFIHFTLWGRLLRGSLSIQECLFASCGQSIGTCATTTQRRTSPSPPTRPWSHPLLPFLGAGRSHRVQGLPPGRGRLQRALRSFYSVSVRRSDPIIRVIERLLANSRTQKNPFFFFCFKFHEQNCFSSRGKEVIGTLGTISRREGKRIMQRRRVRKSGEFLAIFRPFAILCLSSCVQKRREKKFDF